MNTAKPNLKITPKEAVAMQKELRAQISLLPLEGEIRTVAGADVSLEWHGDTAFAGIVVLSFPELEVVEQSLAKQKINFPYIPGLLSFRGIPSFLETWDKLATKPDLTILDGHGIAHPRRMGVAAHFGLVTNSPTIGIAKNRLYSRYDEPVLAAGAWSFLYDEKTDEKIGAVVRTKSNIKPVFVSPGHRVSLEQSIDLALELKRKHRLPEPTRLAHNLVNDFRKNEKERQQNSG